MMPQDGSHWKIFFHQLKTFSSMYLTEDVQKFPKIHRTWDKIQHLHPKTLDIHAHNVRYRVLCKNSQVRVCIVGLWLHNKLRTLQKLQFGEVTRPTFDWGAWESRIWVWCEHYGWSLKKSHIFVLKSLNVYAQEKFVEHYLISEETFLHLFSLQE